MKAPVIHANDARNFWKLGLLGFFVRLRGVISTIILTIVFTTGAPWWYESLNFPTTIEIKIKALIIIIMLLVGSIFAFGFYYLGKRSKRSLDIKYSLHQIAHMVRDENTKIRSDIRSNQNLSKGKQEKAIELFLKDACEKIKSYFSLLTYDTSIEVAIRLAVTDTKEDGKEQIVYKTYARSSGLNSNRSKSSESIPINEGIPKFLRDEHGAQGILIYNNFERAARDGVYKFTKNDSKYPDEIKTAMVAPLNAWFVKEEDMIGILFITSRNEKTFSLKHADAVAFVADMIANAISNIVYLIKFKSMGIDSKGDKDEKYN